jgi:hypothetical protein
MFMRLIFNVNGVTLLQLGLNNTLKLYPFLLHSLSMSVFSSVIGPFGGFFASGFKRAFKIKVGFNREVSCFSLFNSVILNPFCLMQFLQPLLIF